ncbi:imm11 family protein [Thermoactinomyces mirandus]|uniref:Immunity MXAN-0049 protein domain-containing protein n=1 Tax=Thermoactinomyces mirandus TaxID=2756294 RepID=A0A7W1XRJ2_9BACL|nr:DUF1629 domain-containing protein [Thermoactinomyces mirandus]MBA4601974.1 hypothetical protein [Thermoactinomyces mirandus]
MKVYKLSPDYRFKSMMYYSNKDAEYFTYVYDHYWNKEPITPIWKPIRLKVSEIDKDNPNPLPDCLLMLGDVLIFSEKGKSHVKRHLSDYGEFLPLISECGSFYAFHLLEQINALDEEKSEVLRFKSSGRIKRITNYVFKPNQIASRLLFKIPQNPAAIFVTDEFLSLICDSGLQGFDFKFLWEG